ncbi:bifunctional metallophosphatase/5'-nucleotidase [Aerococcaceae bacterium WGS1372]
MRLRILHTNDLHGHLEHWPLLSAYIREAQDIAAAKNEPILTVDIGDAMDSVHPLVEATYGKIIVDLFNEAHYDVVTIGNNEGLNFSKERLSELYSGANYDVTVGNLLDSQTQSIPDYASKIAYKEFEGKTVALVGLTAPYATYGLNGYIIQNPIEAIQGILLDIKQKDVDLIILLSHLGIETDRYIANLFPEIKLIIGAHTHHVFIHGEWENQSLLAASGKFGNYLGDIELYFEEENNDWQFNAKVITIDQLSDMYQLPKESTQYYLEGIGELKERLVALLPYTFSALKAHGDKSFMQMALEAISDEADVDYAILNSGLFLRDLEEGILSEKELHEALPHPMHLAKVTLKGCYLKEMLYDMQSQQEDLRYKLISGLGFRGKVFGELVYKGLSYNETSNQWLAKGQAIDDNSSYTFVTVDHLWFLPFFPMIDLHGNPQLIFPDFIRHSVRNYLQKKHPIGGSEING